MNQIITNRPADETSRIQYSDHSRTNSANYMSATTTLPDSMIEMIKHRVLVRDENAEKEEAAITDD